MSPVVAVVEMASVVVVMGVGMEEKGVKKRRTTRAAKVVLVFGGQRERED